MIQINKYPRTPHIQGSRKQPGDEDLDSTPFSKIDGLHLVVEEKVDGSNSGISFSDEGKLQLQSRGHYLSGGPRERHFALFKSWANTFAGPLYEALSNRYIMYGEWMYAKHTVFYTDLPHYFLEFDIYDTIEDQFLSTERRRAFYAKMPFIVPVKVLFEGQLPSLDFLTDMVDKSEFIADDFLATLRMISENLGLKADQIIKETDQTGIMEGVYLKVEENGIVTQRYKWVRHGFHQTLMDSESHWLTRPIIPNQLAEGVNLFSY